ncbi:protein-L-isoaspartate O-methyltransferase, partial [Candidatus Fermentibacterales bacterium]|nr:protein-L-isoaspartate O-methyltransferase [Candidatus Fermentibacterales bacterium]
PPGTPLEISYGDYPVPIGLGQTVSQPYIVAYMIDLLDLPEESPARVLEVGTGSGYETAILARMGVRVVSVEILPELSARALRALSGLGLEERVALIAADGYNGWSPAAPYDGIVVSAAPPGLPPELPRQLRDGRRLVIPVGSWHQEILVVTMVDGDHIEVRRDLPVRFVPLTKSRGAP